MSNHYHLVLTDSLGVLPDFIEELNKLIARALNCHHGRWENFWSGGEQTSYVRLESSFDVLAKMVYALANPTQALLVAHGHEWPGVRLYRRGSYKALKPAFFFRQCDRRGLPTRVELEISPAPIGLDFRLVDDEVTRAVRAREKQLRDRARAQGNSFVGAGAVRCRSIYSAPRRPADRRNLSPGLACRDRWRRIERLAASSDFVDAHARARCTFMAGNRQVEFPPGTYRFVRQFGAVCQGTPPE